MESKLPERITHGQLVDIAYKWLLKNSSCGIAFKELKSLSWEIPDVIGFGCSGFSVVVECKATRSDFLADKSKPFRVNPSLGMGTNRYYCCPKGLIEKEELPEGWGLVYVDEKGKAKLFHRPLQEYTNTYGHPFIVAFIHEKNIKGEHGLMYSALRRLFIKGHVRHIYDKDYEGSRNVDDLIQLNNPINHANKHKTI
jgi:hypothetical protein